ncbi:hypothetical protein [Mediterraneibacter gnavus]|uniref:Uncharacterized protein n=1 Tax=Mediterraneibacter gnavus TaxID=33038 RepID=A0A2N5PY16_MEDGN|nr:hypothetical protein [Mediterraneibacter gnavus]PLT84555.1 hypothetical protein CDL20_11695 [Mediterraneibacter gnavus]
MIKIQKEDKKQLAITYNTEGKDAMYSVIKEKYMVKNPTCVFTSMKKAAYLAYNPENDRFMFGEQEAMEAMEANIFLDIETLCSGKTQSEKTAGLEKSEVHLHKSMDMLIQELIGERLLKLSQYVSLDPVEKVMRIDETYLKSDGYKLILH